MGLAREQDGLDLVRSEVRILPARAPTGPIVRATRVGLSRARELRLRFALRDDPYVSRPRPWMTPAVVRRGPER